MSQITFEDAGEIRVLIHAFPHKVFNSLTLNVNQGTFEVKALDGSNTMIGRLTFDQKHFSSYNVDQASSLTVDTSGLSKILQPATEKSYEGSEMEVTLFFEKDSLRTLIDVEGRRKIKRMIGDIPTERTSMPRLASFENAPYYSTSDVTLAKQVHRTFEDYNEIDLEIGDNEIVFSVPPFKSEDCFRAFDGHCEGAGKSRILKASLDCVSRIAELSSLLRELHIRIKENRMTRFEYECLWGRIEYSVTPLID